MGSPIKSLTWLYCRLWLNGRSVYKFQCLYLCLSACYRNFGGTSKTTRLQGVYFWRVGFGAHECYHCRISPPRFLAECRKRRLNQGSFDLLYFRLYALFDLYLVFVCLFSCIVFVFSFCMSIFLYSFVCQYQSSHWLWRLPPKWPILYRVGR